MIAGLAACRNDIVKTTPQLQFTRAFRWWATTIAALLTSFAGGLSPCHAAPPSLQPLVEPGKWPESPRGYAPSIQVAGNRAYLGAGAAGLLIIDISNPTNCVRVGKYRPGGGVGSVAVSGNYAYVGDFAGHLQIVDVSNPTNCVRVGDFDLPGEGFSRTVLASPSRTKGSPGPPAAASRASDRIPASAGRAMERERNAPPRKP